jgi:regulator-associated protein of mTOR
MQPPPPPPAPSSPTPPPPTPGPAPPPPPPPSFVTAPFFAEQLTAFEVWLELGSQSPPGEGGERPRPPEQLPGVLQVLLSQVRASFTARPSLPPPNPPPTYLT